VSHGEFLRKNAGKKSEDPELVKQVKNNFYDADLTLQEKTMLEFVGKITLQQKDLRESDVQNMRQAGFDDLQILEVVQLAAWFNYITRVADALGVEVESWRRQWTNELWGSRAEKVLIEDDSTTK
jgi:uncharacterized peroxidase-related enzyme